MDTLQSGAVDAFARPTTTGTLFCRSEELVCVSGANAVQRWLNDDCPEFSIMVIVARKLPPAVCLVLSVGAAMPPTMSTVTMLLDPEAAIVKPEADVLEFTRFRVPLLVMTLLKVSWVRDGMFCPRGCQEIWSLASVTSWELAVGSGIETALVFHDSRPTFPLPSGAHKRVPARGVSGSTYLVTVVTAPLSGPAKVMLLGDRVSMLSGISLGEGHIFLLRMMQMMQVRVAIPENFACAQAGTSNKPCPCTPSRPLPMACSSMRAG